MRRLATLLVATMVAITLVPGIATAAEPRRESIYLSLGTSLAAGSQADANGDTTFSSDESYTDQLYRRIKWRFGPRLRHMKLGCAGETTDQFFGGVNAAGNPSNCAGIYESGSQMGDALAAVHSGDVVLITIDLGANDILQAQQLCGNDLGCLTTQIELIATKVAQIVGTIRANGYSGPIVAMNYYNPQTAAAVGFFAGVPGQHAPDPALAQLSDQLAQGFNHALETAYAATGASVADVYTAFNSGDFGDDRPANGVPDTVDYLCHLSYMCPDDPAVKPNIHLNQHGYRLIARVMVEELRG